MLTNKYFPLRTFSHHQMSYSLVVGLGCQ